MGRLLITVALGLVISVILFLVSFVVLIVSNIVLASINITATGLLAHILASLCILMFVNLPFSIFVGKQIHDAYKVKNLKKLGALGDPFMAGALSLIFLNVLALPYYFLARNDSSVQEVNTEGTFDSKQFINGCIAGFIVDLVLSILFNIKL